MVGPMVGLQCAGVHHPATAAVMARHGSRPISRLGSKARPASCGLTRSRRLKSAGFVRSCCGRGNMETPRLSRRPNKHPRIPFVDWPRKTMNGDRFSIALLPPARDEMLSGAGSRELGRGCETESLAPGKRTESGKSRSPSLRCRSGSRWPSSFWDWASTAGICKLRAPGITTSREDDGGELEEETLRAASNSGLNCTRSAGPQFFAFLSERG